MALGISVIIPTFKRADSLKRVIQLLKAQTIAEQMEILVIDQNPPGFLVEGIGADTLEGVKHLVLEKPNASEARNFGVLNAKYPSLLFLDDDLIPEPTFCEEALTFWSNNEKIDCFCPLVYSLLGEEHELKGIKRKMVKPTSSELFEITDTISAVVFFKKSAFMTSGGFDPLLFEFAKTAEDQEFFLRIAKKGIKLFYFTGLKIFHDEKVPGGCDLRTSDYWETRGKCMRAWVYRYKIHRGGDLKLSVIDLFKLFRSAFLNRQGLTSGFSFVWRQINLLRKSITETNQFLRKLKSCYSDFSKIDHLSTLTRKL
jgi:GT2 family glycosyltransferase